MEYGNFYKLRSPLSFLTNPGGLVRREYSVFIEADAYRTMWIASRFCCGMNECLKQRYQVRLVQEGSPDFELSDRTQSLRFHAVEGYQEDTQERIDTHQLEPRLIEGCVAAVAKAPAASSLVCFVHLVSAAVSDETINKIAQGLAGIASSPRPVWLFIYEEMLEEKEDEEAYPYSLIQVCPQISPRYLFELASKLRQLMIVRTVFIFVGIIIVLGLLQMYTALSKNTGWDVFDIFRRTIEEKLQGQPNAPGL